MKFSDFSLRPEILQAVVDAGYLTPTPIQEQAIPVILTGDDLLGIAQTGTGKTAAFVLPMIERLASGKAKARMPRSLILSPTRELATQSANYFETYGKHVNLTMALLIGGVGMDEQWRRLDRGVDVLIATPGRLLDQFERGKVLLGGVTILVIDEADRMLDMGFIPDVERIVNLVSKRRQTLMFSATMPAEVRRLANAFLTDPKEVQATPPATMAAGIEDHYAVVPPRQKFKALRHLIESHGVDNALIFCNRKREVASLRRQMERVGLSVRDIHGDLDQAQRSAALEAFKRGETAFLVATDVAARGLDIVMLPCVINYDVPTHPDDYVHRIGRTGRAGQAGRAFTLVLPDERRYVDAIARLTGKEIPRLEITGLETTDLAPATGGRGRRGRAAAGAAQASAPRPAAAAPPATVAAAPIEAGPRVEPEPEPEPRAETRARDEARPRAEGRTRARGRTRAEARPGPETRPGAEARPGPETRPGAEARPGPETRPGAEARPRAEARSGAATRPGAEARPEAEARPGAATRPGPEAPPEAGPRPGPEARPGPEGRPEAEAPTRRAARPEAEARARSAARPRVEATPVPETEARMAAKPRPEAEPRSDARPRPGVRARPERARVKPEPAPRPARQRGGGAPPDQPIVGMGDHVPLFMQRPVPQIPELPEAVED